MKQIDIAVLGGILGTIIFLIFALNGFGAVYSGLAIVYWLIFIVATPLAIYERISQY